MSDTRTVAAKRKSKAEANLRGSILSFGGGVQTTALLRMSLAGDIPPRFDAVIFGDTGDEPKAVYDCIEREKAVCAEHGISFVVARAKRFPLSSMAQSGPMIPAYSINADGSHGQLQRFCTTEFKIRVVRREIRRLGFTMANVAIGFSTDEIRRVKPSDDERYTNTFPLIDAGIRRGDCEAYLRRIGVLVAKSACIYCPFRGPAMWNALTDAEFESACAYDESIRNSRPGIKLFVHSSRKPLRVVGRDTSPQLFDATDCGEGCFT